MRLTHKFATLAFATIACINTAKADSDYAIDEGPSWSAGGHYTAEIDLSANTLTFLPLTGTDQVIAFALSKAPLDLRPGVYMLDVNSAGLNLVTTHPEGVQSDAIENRLVIAAGDSMPSTLSLSAQAYALLSDANVGAIYIH